MISDIIEKYFHEFLLSKVTFEINNKPIKKGKLILIAVRDFHIFFKMQSDAGDAKQFIVPMPYNITRSDDNCLCFDYTINCLSQNDKNLFFKLKTTSRKKNTRFYDTVMYCKK
jgi:hypothetical protein